MMLFGLSTNAQSSVQINENLVLFAKIATACYAQSVKKLISELVDHTYGTDLDVGKLVYVPHGV